MERQHRVLVNVALIEARDREERAEMLRLQAGAPVPDHGGPGIEQLALKQQGSEQAMSAAQEQSSSKPQRETERENTLPKMATSADPFEPQPWTPRARVRGK